MVFPTYPATYRQTPTQFLPPMQITPQEQTPPPTQPPFVQSDITVTVDIAEDPHFNPLPVGVSEESLDSLSKFVLQEIHELQDKAAELVKEQRQLHEEFVKSEKTVQSKIMDMQNKANEA